jgi:hypothetical protein
MSGADCTGHETYFICKRLHTSTKFQVQNIEFKEEFFEFYILISGSNHPCAHRPLRSARQALTVLRELRCQPRLTPSARHRPVLRTARR